MTWVNFRSNISRLWGSDNLIKKTKTNHKYQFSINPILNVEIGQKLRKKTESARFPYQTCNPGYKIETIQ